ncbi:MAG: peptidoglycan DD-metalloendopeptidase family protein [Sphingobacteriaceae bacterium]|nr:peptidoglycan DD-metalloendopeptidase family protein [Sphingobacteriaceae bacterium]
MLPEAILREYLSKPSTSVSAVIDFKRGVDKLVRLDLTDNNKSLDDTILSDTALFSSWIDREIADRGGRYGIGGYNEHRAIYRRSSHFDSDDEPRRLHLGTDIWAKEGSLIYCPLNGKVHSFKFNNNFGDYGGTIILKHQFESLGFYTLFGHLSLQSLSDLSEGKKIFSGQKLATLGNAAENGNWPPHLHFQLIFDLEGMRGDYPGVCKLSESDHYLFNCPNPEIILQHTF